MGGTECMPLGLEYILCTYQCKAPLPHIRAEVGEGGDLHFSKIQIPTNGPHYEMSTFC